MKSIQTQNRTFCGAVKLICKRKAKTSKETVSSAILVLLFKKLSSNHSSVSFFVEKIDAHVR